MLKSEWKAQPMQPCVMHVVLVPVQFVGRLRVKRGSYRWSQLASTSGSSCWKETTERTLELTSLVSGLTGGSVWGLAMTSQVCCCWLCLVASCFYVQGYFTGPENSVRDGEKLGLSIYLPIDLQSPNYSLFQKFK